MNNTKLKTGHCYFILEDHNGQRTEIDLGKYDLLGWLKNPVKLKKTPKKHLRKAWA